MNDKIIFLADMESFYASVEKAEDPSLQGKPVVVCGDPVLRGGIILAASPEAKAFGIKTAQPAWEARRLCPWVVFVHPRMQLYIDYSIRITAIFERFTDRILPYSIDEQFLDLTGTEKMFPSPRETAQRIMDSIVRETGVRCRIGMGENLLQAKMACDCFAKKSEDCFFVLNADNYATHTWPLPVRALFGVGHRMERNLNRMGVRTIGHLAALPRKILARRWGINGELLWLNAQGIDYAEVSSDGLLEQKGIGHTATLPRDYRRSEEIELVLLEMIEEVCHRTRKQGKIGSTVHLHCRGADFDRPGGFARQRKLPEPTANALDIYPAVLKLFYCYWDRKPLRALGVSLTGLTSYRQLSLIYPDRRKQEKALLKTADLIRERFGKTSLFRASSLQRGAQFFQRSGKIGGQDA